MGPRATQKRGLGSILLCYQLNKAQQTTMAHTMGQFSVTVQHTKKKNTDLCPSLCNSTENEHHFLQCPHCQRTSKFNELQQKLTKCFKQHKIDPELRRTVISMTKTNQMEQTAPFTHTYVQLLRDQRKLGIDSLFFGMFHKNWIEYQK